MQRCGKREKFAQAQERTRAHLKPPAVLAAILRAQEHSLLQGTKVRCYLMLLLLSAQLATLGEQGRLWAQLWLSYARYEHYLR